MAINKFRALTEKILQNYTEQVWQVSKENIQCIIIYVKVTNRLNRTSFFRDMHVGIKLQGEEENDYHNSQHTITTRKQVGSTNHTWEY